MRESSAIRAVADTYLEALRVAREECKQRHAETCDAHNKARDDAWNIYWAASKAINAEKEDERERQWKKAFPDGLLK